MSGNLKSVRMDIALLQKKLQFLHFILAPVKNLQQSLVPRISICQVHDPHILLQQNSFESKISNISYKIILTQL